MRMPISPLARRAATAALALAALCAPRLEASAEDIAASQAVERAQDLRYRIFLGGANIGSARFRLESQGEGYSGSFSLQSGGVADLFTEAEVRTEATGAWDGRGGLTPSNWSFFSDVDGKTLDVQVSFNNVGPESVEADPPYRPRDYEIDPMRQYGAVDPVSAVVQAMYPETQEEVCRRSLDIFDGRRRYEIALTRELRREREDGYVEVDCAASWRRVAGYSARDMRKPGFDLTIRFRLMEDGRTLPIRAWTQTEFGGAIVVLRGFEER